MTPEHKSRRLVFAASNASTETTSYPYDSDTHTESSPQSSASVANCTCSFSDSHGEYARKMPSFVCAPAVHFLFQRRIFESPDLPSSFHAQRIQPGDGVTQKVRQAARSAVQLPPVNGEHHARDEGCLIG
jgi:hypothetical protein